MRRFVETASIAAATAMLVTGVLAAGPNVPNGMLLSGKQAFGGWQQAKPGLRLLIRPSEIPPPFSTKPVSNPPATVGRPQGAKPHVMSGFSVAAFATGLKQPRVIRIAPNGDIFVSDSAAGTIHVYRMAQDGSIAKQAVFASGLNRPYGIAFYPNGGTPQYVYVANTGSVVRFAYHSGDMQASGKPETIVPTLPTGYHWTRDLVFAPDGKTLFVSVGSGSNDALHTMPPHPPSGFANKNPTGAAWGDEHWRADVLAVDPDGGNRRIFATGLRNCSGMTLQPSTGNLWCVVNERDMLGDNVPPDYATHVEKGQFYGWPWYYIGDHLDPRWKTLPHPEIGSKVVVPDVLFEAHSAPLGISFYTGDMFPSDFKGDAFVAMHGSWNRAPRTGYKVVRVLFKDGKATGEYQDFMTGFVVNDEKVWGRPVDAAMAQDGSLLVSDDASGTIWRVTAGKSTASQ